MQQINKLTQPFPEILAFCYLREYVCLTKLKKILYGPYLWMGFNCLKTTEPLRGVSLLFTSISPEVPGTHFTNLWTMRDCVWPWSHTQQMLRFNWASMRKISYIEKMKIIPQIVFELLKFKKSCNLIDEEHFGL